MEGRAPSRPASPTLADGNTFCRAPTLPRMLGIGFLGLAAVCPSSVANSCIADCPFPPLCKPWGTLRSVQRAFSFKYLLVAFCCFSDLYGLTAFLPLFFPAPPLLPSIFLMLCEPIWRFTLASPTPLSGLALKLSVGFALSLSSLRRVLSPPQEMSITLFPELYDDPVLISDNRDSSSPDAKTYHPLVLDYNLGGLFSL